MADYRIRTKSSRTKDMLTWPSTQAQDNLYGVETSEAINCHPFSLNNGLLEKYLPAVLEDMERLVTTISHYRHQLAERYAIDNAMPADWRSILRWAEVLRLPTTVTDRARARIEGLFLDPDST